MKEILNPSVFRSVVSFLVGFFALCALQGTGLVSTPVQAYKLPDTGQNLCYDNDQEIPCPQPGQPFYGQDGNYQGPQMAYQDNGDGTVTDLNTGIMWQQGDAQNEGDGRTWQDAVDYCATLDLGGVYRLAIADGHGVDRVDGPRHSHSGASDQYHFLPRVPLVQLLVEQ
jgi:hypothetical protein